VDELSELEVVGRIVRNATDEVLVKTGMYRLIDVVDIRWFHNGRPNVKGIRVNREEAKLLLEILKRELDE
tara:strand:+ start:345 stop:554 length:210 start_codon:yes stop_codon:yes gene_type:complete